MTSLRRYAYIVFGVACTHLVFGAIVRISGSGMGCGDHWPRCYGSFFPPLNRPDLIIEVSHRYLASILLLSLIALLAVAWRRRAEAGVGGPGGVLRSTGLAVALGFCAALLGAMTVKMGNAPFATLAHWTVAMSLVAAVVATVIRAGGLGGARTRLYAVSARTRRATMGGAAMALVAVVMGGLTAKYPGAAVACLSFPLCGTNPDVQRAAVHVQLTHRIIALLLVLHLFGLLMVQRKRRESPVMLRAVTIAFSLGVLQLLVAGAMIGMHLPPVLRSLHEAAGVSIWIATFALAYLARRAGPDGGVASPTGGAPRDAGVVRASTPVKSSFASAVTQEGTREGRQHVDGWRVALVDAHLGAAVSWQPRYSPVVKPLVVAAGTADAILPVAAAEREVAGEVDVERSASELKTAAVVAAEQLAAEQLAAEQLAAEQLAEEQLAVAHALAATAQRVADNELKARHDAELADLQATIAGVVAAERLAAERAADTAIAIALRERELADVEQALADLGHDTRAIPVVAEEPPEQMTRRAVPEPQPAAAVLTPLAPILARRSTMSHSIAVIVARGADF